jgi:hypothetical protein
VSRIRWKINESKDNEVVTESPETTTYGTTEDAALLVQLGSSERRLVTVQELERNGGYFAGFKALAAFNHFKEDLGEFLRYYAHNQDWWQESLEDHAVRGTSQVRYY